MNKKRKICFITGTRADYGLMKATLKRIAEDFDLSLLVAGMHLSPEFGSTIEEIKKDGVFSLWNGHLAFRLAPALSSFI